MLTRSSNVRLFTISLASLLAKIFYWQIFRHFRETRKGFLSRALLSKGQGGWKVNTQKATRTLERNAIAGFRYILGTAWTRYWQAIAYKSQAEICKASPTEAREKFKKKTRDACCVRYAMRKTKDIEKFNGCTKHRIRRKTFLQLVEYRKGKFTHLEHLRKSL